MLLESFKKKELKLLARQVQNKTLQYNNFQKRLLNLITECTLAKAYKNLVKKIISLPAI